MAAPDAILVARSPGETRYALLAGEAVVELVHRRDADIHPGMVCPGRVTARVPGINAVFVDIGDAVPGVLALKPPIPAEGSAVMVRVTVPPRGGKGAELKRADGVVPAAAPDPALVWWTRHRDSIEHIICEPAAEARRLKALLGEDANIESHSRAAPLFTQYGVDEAIETALQPDVPLPCGGRLRIETTAAVTAVDVDSGPANPETANLQAIAAVARELRLRDIAGHIVVDIIPVGRKAPLARALAKAVADDPVETQVAGLTPLGMIELTRRRVGLSLAETLGPAGALSAASLAYEALRRAVREATAAKTTVVTIAVHTDVAALMQGGLRAALAEAADMAKAEFMISARPDFPRERIEITSGRP